MRSALDAFTTALDSAIPGGREESPIGVCTYYRAVREKKTDAEILVRIAGQINPNLRVFFFGIWKQSSFLKTGHYAFTGKKTRISGRGFLLSLRKNRLFLK